MFYCDAACQRRHWPVHKPDCRAVEAMRRAVAGVGGAVPAPALLDDPEARAASSCGICLAGPIVDPFAIPGCDHAFCFECLKSWQQHKVKAWAMTGVGGREVTCPLCRTEFGDVESTVVERAVLLSQRATRRAEGGPPAAEEREKLTAQALAELDMVLTSNSRHVPALSAKAEVLLGAGRPAEALRALDAVLAADAEAQADEASRMALIDGIEFGRAMADGRGADVDRLLAHAEGLAATAPLSRVGGSGPGRLFKVHLERARALEALGDWDGATRVYVDRVLSAMDSPLVGTPPEQRAMWMGLSRCFYETKDYAKAISAGSAAVEMNRHFPGVHKCVKASKDRSLWKLKWHVKAPWMLFCLCKNRFVALAQKAAGDLAGARRTMARAAIYETPWDKANREEAAALHRALMVDDKG